MQSRLLMRARAVGVGAVVVLAGCTGNPPEGSSAYKTGSLGNGGFVFSCADGVACDEFSTGYAADFPKNGVATGSSFNIFYVPKDEQDKPALTEPTDGLGITVRALGPLFTGGNGGDIVASGGEGFGAIVAQTANGVVADFTSIQIVRPASITIYDAQITLFNQAQDVGDSYSITKGTTHDFRLVAKSAGNLVLAGSLQQAWETDHEDIATVAVNNGVATLTAHNAGTANLSLTSASFTRNLKVTVTP